jgi:hypothetical protein
MNKSAGKYPAIAYVALRSAIAYAVCSVVYLFMQPGGIGGMLWYFILTAGLGIPVALAISDIPRGFTASAIAVRSATGEKRTNKSRPSLNRIGGGLFSLYGGGVLMSPP